ncbi:DsbA family oxidoreductase [Bacillus sp. 2205SS5-2]|uniref:DsbA family oxidoreductase n=1 Tax=Bacillus sp. 2205SS5-2 TaxID=3109031 RepID=UPI0030040E19
MKIEVYSDFVCPFCYIGKRRLEQAMEAVPFKDEVEVVFKSYELDPNAAKDTDLSLHELLANKYGTSVEQAKKMSDGVIQQAGSVGLDFQFDQLIPTNTFDAHRLAKYAETQGKEAALTESLLKAHFTDSKHVGDHDTLLQIAEEVGLDRSEAQSVLAGNDFNEVVRQDEQLARSIGVQGVPFFVVNNKYAISGAQPAEVFKGALEKVWEEEHPSTPLQNLSTGDNNGMVCDENGCEIPTDKQ